MRPVLVYQHQTRFNGSQNKTSLELEVLRSFLYRCLIAVERGACPGRNRFLEIRSPLLLSWSHTGNRILCKRLFLHRLVHPAGFFQTGIKPLPLHFGTRIIATTSIGRSGRRLEGIEIRVIVYLRRLYRTSLLECRNIRHVLGIKIDSRYSAELAQGFLDRSRQNLPDSLLILELNLRLRRMDVHIDIGRVYLEINKVGDLLTGRNQLFISIHHRFVEIGVTHIAPVHKKVLVRSFLARRFRLGYKTGNLYHGRIDVDGQQLLIQLLSEDCHDALPQRHYRKIEQFRIITIQIEGYLRMHQRYTLEFRKDVAQLRRVRFQEFAPGRNIEE